MCWSVLDLFSYYIYSTFSTVLHVYLRISIVLPHQEGPFKDQTNFTYLQIYRPWKAHVGRAGKVLGFSPNKCCGDISLSFFIEGTMEC